MRRLIFITVALLSMVFGLTCSAAGIPQDCRNLLLEEKWQALFETLKKDNSLTADPVARLLMGHACLANNRNNESILLFLSAKEEEDLSLWSEWTESLLRRHSKNPVALYLSADAKARIGRLDEANETFTQALRIRNNFALALNARGVVRVLNSEWDEALIDFYQATTLAPEFADAYANLGTYWVIKEVSGTGAVDAFNHAITINPNFALAYNGRGSLYFGSGEFEKAARDFNMAFQLSPALLVAEVNQGLTSAYASQLITLAGLTKKKPGTTLNSLIQQYPNILKEQKQDLLKMLPTNKNQAFWKKMDTFPTLSQNQISSLVKEHGLQKVQMGAFLKMQGLKGQIAGNYPGSRPAFTDKIAFFNDASSFSFYSLGMDKNIQQLWKEPFSARTTDVSKVTSISPPPAGHIIFCSPGVGPSGAISLPGHIALSLGGGRVYEMPGKDELGKLAQAPRITTWNKLIQTYSSVHSVPIPDATPNAVDRFVKRAYEVAENPAGYYSEPYNVNRHNCIQSVKHLAQDVGLNLGNPNWKISEHPWQFYTWLRIKGARSLTSSQELGRLQQQSMAAGQLYNIDTKLNILNAMPTVSSTKQLLSHIPGYYTSTSRPLTELGALASMVDRGIKPVESSARSALIVSQDRFRANLLQSELSKHGFQTKVILPGIDPQAQAKRWGADVILGIKDPPKKFYDDIERKIPPPFPPGGGGGGPGPGGAAISTPQMVQPQVKQNWDWGKSFIPTYPKSAPGGISTEELARSFVDKGNWPVMTSFSLFYEVTTLGSESEKGK